MAHFNPAIMKAIEKLDYRVTVGDVASQSGLPLNVAQQALFSLAAEANGHLQVAETGDIVYRFPAHFRNILRNKYWRLRFKEWLEKAWQILFYLIRISFGVILISSIIIMMIAITAIIVGVNMSQDNDSNSEMNISFLPNFTDLFIIFYPNYYGYSAPRHSQKSLDSKSKLNFLEAIYSFLFGDGNPNNALEERRWHQIGAIIRQNGGAIIAEQVAPYLDNISAIDKENEDYMLSVLSKFNGYPHVSEIGDIIYHFPELQVTAQRRSAEAIFPYLSEKLWQFSQASSGQILLAIGLGGLNFILALMLGSFLQEYTFSGSFLPFIESIYWVLFSYATAFLGIPFLRYFWIQWRNQFIEARNEKRQARAEFLSIAYSSIAPKINFAHQFAAENVITDQDITYSTDKDVLEQEIEQSDKIDQEWQKRLNARE